MLPKPIKNLKSNNSVEQLNLTDTVSTEDKIKNKRRAVIIFLLLTVGLSFIFWAYNSVNSFIKNPKLPTFSFNFNNLKIKNLPVSSNPTDNPDLEKEADSVISKDQNVWSIYVQSVKNQETVFSWSKNYVAIPEEINKIVNDLSQTPVSTNEELNAVLPSGAQVQGSSLTRDGFYQLQTLITIPQQQFIIVIKITGNNINNSIKSVPELIERLYWSLIQLS